MFAATEFAEQPGHETLLLRRGTGVAGVLFDDRGAFVQSGPNVVGGVGTSLPFVPGDDGAGSGDAGDPGHSDPFPQAHVDYLNRMPHSRPGNRISLDEAVELARTGDVWLFRGSTPADRAIQTVTNSPVNHVGMAVVLEDLPPLLWHAELGRSLPDMWTGQRQRGVQLHDLHAAVSTWKEKYHARAWMRQLSVDVTREMEDAVLKTIARFDGKPFPTTRGLAQGWITGRLRYRRSAETIYCAELVAVTYQAMGLLADERPQNWYDPGRFWSGDRLELLQGATLGDEISVGR